ncbi:MAG: L-aspartate oxidase [Thermomicrobiales bacterium]|jgi:L-aspartate oxidase|nr:L-aspartate oxidase [Thermomicrobiales bacterium]
MNRPAVSSPPIDLARFAKPLSAPAHAVQKRHLYDVVVVGAGVAGLAFMLRLPPTWRVALLTKGALGESNTRYAQGGLSAAIGVDDSPDLHEADTLAAGAGLCDPDAVRRLVAGAPDAVRWLLDVGTRFDRDAATGEMLLGREAAHSRRRVLHAGGDATGAEIERALVAAVHARPMVDVWERSFAIDLAVADGRCAGLIAELVPDEPPTLIEASTVVIAAGGAGQLWATSSNPPGATADGLAMALRAGVAVADVEFAQFHPTVLALPGSAPFLVSEAVRGENAYLRGKDGERFMTALHPSAELAPRDVVARGIQRQMALDGADHAFLDLRHLDGAAMRTRFPTISRELAARGLDLAADLIPVAPAAHYFMGGIVAGTDGKTSLPGLLALGEAACTGVHGANRLASNSLLEGLVFGLEAADCLTSTSRGPGGVESTGTAARVGAADQAHLPAPDPTMLDALRTRIQRAMSCDVAVIREAEGLARAAAVVRDALLTLASVRPADRTVWEVQNLALVAGAVVTAATLRHESRGAHFRADFPEPNPALVGCHLSYGGDGCRDWRFSSLQAAGQVG